MRCCETDPSNDMRICAEIQLQGLGNECWHYFVEVGGGAGAVCPIHTPLHVCIGGLGASLPSHSGYEPL